MFTPIRKAEGTDGSPVWRHEAGKTAGCRPYAGQLALFLGLSLGLTRLLGRLLEISELWFGLGLCGLLGLAVIFALILGNAD